MVGPVRVSWFTGQSSTPIKSSASWSTTPDSHPGEVKPSVDVLSRSSGVTAALPLDEALHRMHEEEEEGRGWGGDDEDGFGML